MFGLVLLMLESATHLVLLDHTMAHTLRNALRATHRVVRVLEEQPTTAPAVLSFHRLLSLLLVLVLIVHLERFLILLLTLANCVQACNMHVRSVHRIHSVLYVSLVIGLVILAVRLVQLCMDVSHVRLHRVLILQPVMFALSAISRILLATVNLVDILALIV